MDRLQQLAARLETEVAEGALAGWVAGVRHRGGGTEIVCGGRRWLDGPPMSEDTLFRIASCTKPIGGALTLTLVERGVLGLDDDVTRWLPELAGVRVLRRPGGDLDDTEPRRQPITVRHLLTMTAGFGWVPEEGPLSRAMDAQGLAPGPFPPAMGPEEYLRRLGGLPLAHQPGESWLYHTSSDVLGVLLARAAGRPLDELLVELVTGPLGMTDTGFWTAATDRLATTYGPPIDGVPMPYDVPAGVFVTPPEFLSLATGLVAGVPDHLRFLGALLDDGAPILGRASVAEMATDHLTDGQRPSSAELLADGAGWGLNVEVTPAGRFGWAGGLGTIGYVNPSAGLAGVLHTQHTAETEATQRAFDAFLAAVD